MSKFLIVYVNPDKIVIYFSLFTLTSSPLSPISPPDQLPVEFQLPVLVTVAD